LRDQLAEGALQTLGAWREFFAAELESASFRDSAIDSPVVMTSMERAQLRRFEAVLLLGAGEAHLGAEREPGPLLAAQLRAQLQLETPRERQDRLRDTLGMLIAHAQEFHATWLAGSADEPQPLSPWLVRVDVLARAAGQPGLVLQEAPEPPWQGTVAPAVAPAPAAPGLRPPTLSVSAYGSLIACPYQFFARHLLGLNEADEVREEFEKSDYGQWVHDLLNRLHARFPRFTGLAHDVLRTTFERIADDVFAPAIEFNFLSLGWKQRWVALADAYIAWQLEREAAGWLWQAGEVAAEMPFVLADGAGVSLRGRLDRIDRGRDGALEILDYKTQDLVALRRKVAEPGEDVQLAAYRLLHPHGEAATAAYVAVDGKRIGTVPANQAHDPAAEGRRLVALVGAIDAGAGLPANAPDPACSWCEMRGLCRRDHWRAEGRGDA
jgi:ATP-dependent helicase/nuclease subunit B